MRSSTMIISAAIIGSTVIGGVAAACTTPAKAQNNEQTKISYTEKKESKYTKEVKTATVTRTKKEKKTESDHKYTICHATNSATNPYVMITVDYNSIVKNAGHDGHDGPIATSEAVAAELKADKISWGDVIPAIAEHDYAGKNFTAEGILLLNNDCEMPTVTAQEDDDDENDTPVDNGGGSNEETDEPGLGGVDDTDDIDVPETTPGEEAEESVDEPGVGGVAEELPETGAASIATVLTLIASVAVAGVTYGAQHLRTLRAASFLKNL